MQEPMPPTPGMFLGNQMPQQPTFVPPPKRRRSWGAILVAILIVGGTLAGIGAAVYGVLKAKDAADTAINHSNEVSDPHLSSNDREALGLAGNEQFLFEGGAPAAITAALDNGIPGQPTSFTMLSLYSDYAIATAQNPTLPDHLDQYIWRTGSLGSSTPQPSDAEAPTMAFTVDAVDWVAISNLVADAVRISKVEQGEVSYLIVQRDTFTAELPMVVRIYVNGPRGSAYIQAAADGTVINVF